MTGRNVIIRAAVCILLTAAVLVSPFVSLAEGVSSQEVFKGIVDYSVKTTDSKDVQDWIQSALIPNAGAGAEWYLLSAAQGGVKVDGAAYGVALTNTVSDGRNLSSTELLKYALTLCALKQTDHPQVQSALEGAVGAQGVMSYIYGLHLLNNGLESPRFTAEEALSELLYMRKADGGWAVMGNYSDTDVTAMALQVLAPYYESDPRVRAAADEALEFLSKKQKDSGAFIGFGGGENLESTAQVLIALCSLKIDPRTDARFIKQGNSCFDGLLAFRLSDGSFCHVADGGYNSTATVQALMASVSLWRYERGLNGIYIMSPAPDGSILAGGDSGLSYKLVAIIVAAALALAAAVILYLCGKRSVKNFIFILLSLALVSALILVTDFQSTKSYYSGQKTEKSEAVGSVTMCIRCDVIVPGSADKDYVPRDGVILPDTVFEFEEGETAFDILTQAARAYNIQLDSRGSSISMVYVKGINYIYEYDYGEQSGWMYYVNGIAPSVNSGEYKLRDGDVIQWMYSRDIGADLRDYIYTPSEN